MVLWIKSIYLNLKYFIVSQKCKRVLKVLITLYKYIVFFSTCFFHGFWAILIIAAWLCFSWTTTNDIFEPEISLKKSKKIQNCHTSKWHTAASDICCENIVNGFWCLMISHRETTNPGGTSLIPSWTNINQNTHTKYPTKFYVWWHKMKDKTHDTKPIRHRAVP